MALNLTKKQYETEMARGEALNKKYGKNNSSSSNKNTSNGNSGGSGGNSGGSSGSSSGGSSSAGTAAYYAQLQAEAEARAAAEAERLRAQQERIAQNAYDRNMAALNDAYEQRSNLLKQNYMLSCRI